MKRLLAALVFALWALLLAGLALLMHDPMSGSSDSIEV